MRRIEMKVKFLGEFLVRLVHRYQYVKARERNNRKDT